MDRTTRNAMKFDIKVMMRLGLITLVGMSAIALVIDRFSETVDIASMIMLMKPLWMQLAVGTALGLIIGYAAYFLIGLSFMEPVREKYSNMFQEFDLSLSEIWFISFCAGVGEELLFRGALQPIFGIPVISVVFVAIHGYLDPRNWRLSVYGVFMVLMIAGIGLAAEKIGLLAAISAHMLIDVVLLGALIPRKFKA